MIRWDEPIEAVHDDGRVVPVALRKWHRGGQMHDSPDDDGDYYTTGNFEWSAVWNANGRHWLNEGPWRIRNVAQDPQTGSTAPSPSEVGPEVTERMIALVKAVAQCTWADAGQEHGIGSIPIKEARAIVALLPEPVDADLLEVRRIVADALTGQGTKDNILAGDFDNTPSIQAPLACLKRGRALEKEAGR